MKNKSIIIIAIIIFFMLLAVIRGLIIQRKLTDNILYSKDNTTEQNITAIVDTVPIPKGFVASPYEGENTKSGGLVIYELKNGETAIPLTETHQTSLTTRNQYVWIPAEDYNTFIRSAFDNDIILTGDLNVHDAFWEAIPDVDMTYSETLIAEEYEICVEQEWYSSKVCNDKYTKQIKYSDLISSDTLKEVKEMYESVKEHKGFYIARYEAGIDRQRTEENSVDSTGNILLEPNVYSMMNKIPYTYIPWSTSMLSDTNGAVEAARNIYPNNNYNKTGVVSTLIYGVQWDTTIQWLFNSKVIDDTNESTDYGNYSESRLTSQDFNDGARYAKWSYSIDENAKEKDVLSNYQTVKNGAEKEKYTIWELSTGALKKAKLNNIYDMAGNLSEWTMEGYTHSNSTDIERVSRDIRGIAERNICGINNTSNTFRVALYIKK